MKGVINVANCRTVVIAVSSGGGGGGGAGEASPLTPPPPLPKHFDKDIGHHQSMPIGIQSRGGEFDRLKSCSLAIMCSMYIFPFSTANHIILCIS